MREALKSVGILLLCLAPLIVIARLVQDTSAVPATPLIDRPLIAADALSFYVQKLFVPVGLTIDYARNPSAVLADPLRHLAWIVPVALLGMVVALRRRYPLLVGGILVFVAGLLPVLGLTSFMFQIHSTVADHYVYLAMLGPALIVAALVTRFDRLEIYFAAGAIAITLACLTLRQQMYWHDSVTLFTRATAITPDNASAHTNLGNALAERGELDDAVQQFEKAARLRPDDYFAQQCLAQALLQQHEYERSVEHAQDSLAHIPPRESPLLDHLIIAMSLNRLSRFDEAVPHLEAILQADPNNGRAAHELVIAKRHSLAP